MKIQEHPKIIVITGAESTGKSVLTSYLGHVFTSPWYPEYAREYLEKSGPVYSRHDVETIAHVQFEQMEEALKIDAHFVFFDTWLIITKIWMEVVYGECPEWISQAISSAPVDLFYFVIQIFPGSLILSGKMAVKCVKNFRGCIGRI